MSVYVDHLRDWGWKLGKSCHMLADSLDELHEMARKIGMRRSWFQNRGRSPHYDLVKSRRIRAVKLGAVELKDEEFVGIIKGKPWEAKG